MSEASATMVLMPKCRRSRSLCAALLALALASSCSRRMAIGDTNSQSDSRALPFHGNADASAPGDPASHPEVPDQRDTSKGIPFNFSASAVLPAGTLLSVRLKNTLTSAMPDGPKTFLALVEEPVTIEGRTVIPRDAEVKGRVESARVSDARRKMGYLRLTLDSIRIGDKQFSLPTSSLFARGIIDSTNDDYAATGSRARPIAARPQVIRLKKGRPLTFRLTAAVDLNRPIPAADNAQSGTK
jgi:hypothetical protein